uniref:Mating type gene n=1 Tax=Diaporthe sp. 930811-17 TaxID=309388 RepID=Q1MX47_9PEZI|nr:mating type gene [Diaporthe sp. 930811-17]
MFSEAKEILGGQAKVQAVLDKQHKVKDGRLANKDSTTAAGVVKIRVPRYDWVKKKSVNAYIIYRVVMSLIFASIPQAQRSAYIRAMWEKEHHKTAWSLIAKVWTHIRDFSGGFTNLVQYAAAAMRETRVVTPDRWLNTYHMVLVRDQDGIVTLRQHHVPSIPAARQLTDVELLFGVLRRGLPVNNPVQLLDSLVKSQNHYMAVSTFPGGVAVPGRANQNFVGTTDYDPITTFTYLSQLAPADSFLAAGVNIIDAERPDVFDADLLTNPGTGTITEDGFEFDDSTAHLALLGNGALDMSSMMDAPQNFEIGIPPQWDDFSGQITQDDHTGQLSEPLQDDTPVYPINSYFDDGFPTWELQ